MFFKDLVLSNIPKFANKRLYVMFFVAVIYSRLLKLIYFRYWLYITASMFLKASLWLPISENLLIKVFILIIFSGY